MNSESLPGLNFVTSIESLPGLRAYEFITARKNNLRDTGRNYQIDYSIQPALKKRGKLTAESELKYASWEISI